MRTLVIDTATSACSVALFDGQDLVASHYEVIGRGHAERLVPFIQDLPGNGRADQIAVNTGPGSFTGIRVGISAARALAFAWGVPCTGYSCLQLVAAMPDVPGVPSVPGPVDAIMKGGHGEYFFQQFCENGTALSVPVSMPLATALALSSALIITGDAARLLGEAETEAEADDSKVIFECMPDARKWHRIAHHPVLSSAPFYGRAPDAKLPGGVLP